METILSLLIVAKLQATCTCTETQTAGFGFKPALHNIILVYND